jgi:agmatinase
MTVFDPSVYVPTGGFMAAPSSWDLSLARAAVLGIPFDCGTHAVRIGARLGPTAIREQSSLVRRFEPPLNDYDPIERLGLVDCGNVKVTPGVIGESYAAIEEAMWRIVSAGVIPMTMGGDGAVTLPQLRAVHRKYPDLVVLHIDAHTDTYPGGEGERGKYNTGTTFTRAAEEGLVDPANSFHIGARGTTYLQGGFTHTRSMGYELIDGIELSRRGMDDVVRQVHERLAGRPVYLCFDMDFFDPSCAPGVCTPTWGGANAGQGLALLQSLSGLRFVSFDINTVSPPHDVGGMTAFLAGTCMHQFMILACRSLGLANTGAEIAP